jgi:hypothetical protein
MPSTTLTHKQTENELNETQLTAKQLDNIAKLQQMKLNCRLVALERATVIMACPGFLDRSIQEHGANSVTVITAIAIAKELEGYILDNIEEETEEVLRAARENLNKPRIVRP